MSNPLFSPHSLYWRVNREWLIALAAPRAVLLELAHPSVAAGVAQHSDYRRDPFGRLYRTMKTMTDISFGETDEAHDALRHFHQCHAVVNGKMWETRGLANSVREEIIYDANDPRLKLWVWATLVDSVLHVYERFVTPLTYADKSAYYDDAARLARMLGIPSNNLPPTLTAFHLYMGAMLYGKTLQVTRAAREVVHALYSARFFGRLMRAFSFASLGLLPAHLRAAYGFEWDEVRAVRLEQFASVSRRIRTIVPTRLAIHPKAWSAERKYFQLERIRKRRSNERKNQFV